MALPLRQSGVVDYRRYVVDTIISALQSAFDSGYARERQLTDLHVVHKLPIKEAEYPAIVVDFVDRRVANAGVGHEEWFPDEGGILRRWNHSRFEGSINLDLYARSTIDRDLLADALVEILRYGRLDSQLIKFFEEIYPGSYFSGEYEFLLTQLMINTDEIDGRGTSSQAAPWKAEDVLIYSIGYSLETHGAFYNRPLTNDYSYLTEVLQNPYASDDVSLIFDHDPFTNPFQHIDAEVVAGKGRPITTAEHPKDYSDTGRIVSYGVPSWV